MLKSLRLLLVIGLAIAHPDNRPIQNGSQPPHVTTNLGEIEGAVLRTRLGKPIFAFRGIRYANAPVNELRFQVDISFLIFFLILSFSYASSKIIHFLRWSLETTTNVNIYFSPLCQ